MVLRSVRFLLLPAVLAAGVWMSGPATALTPVRDTAWSKIHRQAAAEFQVFLTRHGQVEADWLPSQPGVHMLLNLDEPLPGDTLVQRGDGFLRANEGMLGVPASQLQYQRTSSTKQRETLRYSQMVRLGDKTLPVLDGEVTLTFDKSNGHLLRLVNATQPVLNLTAGALSREDAVAKASQAAAGATFGRGSAAAAEEAVIAGVNGARHVWIVHVPGASLRDLRTFAVDAQSGVATRMPNRVMD